MCFSCEDVPKVAGARCCSHWFPWGTIGPGIIGELSFLSKENVLVCYTSCGGTEPGLPRSSCSAAYGSGGGIGSGSGSSYSSSPSGSPNRQGSQIVYSLPHVIIVILLILQTAKTQRLYTHVLILLILLPRRTQVSQILHLSGLILLYVSPHYYIGVRILLNVCPRITVCALIIILRQGSQILHLFAVLRLLHMCSHTIIYVPSMTSASTATSASQVPLYHYSVLKSAARRMPNQFMI